MSLLKRILRFFSPSFRKFEKQTIRFVPTIGQTWTIDDKEAIITDIYKDEQGYLKIVFDYDENFFCCEKYLDEFLEIARKR